MSLVFDINSVPNVVYGLSTDEKPLSYTTGALFRETDTKKEYIFNGENWGKHVPPMSNSSALPLAIAKKMKKI